MTLHHRLLVKIWLTWLRLQHKEAGTRYEKNVQEAEFLMEKAKQRFDNTAEELERILVTKEGESLKDASKLYPP